MSIKKLTINGLRGFNKETEIEFALPDNKTPGSGLTVLVGPNNSGKSTIIEAVHLLTNDYNSDIVLKSARNIKSNGKIFISIEDVLGNTRVIETTKNQGAFIQKKSNGETVDVWGNNINVFILSSKRSFSSTFSNNNYQTREIYKGNVSNGDYRNENNINNNFGGRLLTILKNKSTREKFDECLGKVLQPIPNWTIESHDSDSLYLEFLFDEFAHSSNGAGDGYINIFNIIDALYDSSENNVILIDEPEISLHPDLQRKLFSLLVEYSRDKQIIVSTHSPYFVDWSLFIKKSKIFRLRKENDSIEIYHLNEATKIGIVRFICSKYPEGKKGLVEDFKKYEVNHQYEDSLKELMEKIDDYFNTEKITSEETPVKEKRSDNELDVDERLLAESLLNTKNNKVKLKNKKVVSNTLPINRIQKMIGKIIK